MFFDIVAEGRYEKDQWEESRRGRRYGTGKLEIFIAASFPFYAESRERGRFHSTRLKRDSPPRRHYESILLNDAGRSESYSRESNERALTKAIVKRE